MKQVSTLLFTGALALGAPALANEMSEMHRYANSAQMELDMETGGCLKTLTVQNNTIDKMKALLDQRKGRIVELENSMQPLSNALDQCKDKLAGVQGQNQSELNALSAENRKLKTLTEEQQRRVVQLERGEAQLKKLTAENEQLKQQLAKSAKAGDNAAEFALYATSLEGEIKSLKEQIGNTQAENNRLNQEISALRVQLTPSSAPSTDTTPLPVQTPILSQPTGKIAGKLLSLRRNTSKNKDELVIGVALTNTTDKIINGILVGPEITAIDNANNMFAIADSRNVKGITTCEYGKKLYNEMSWCENQLKKNAFSTTSFRPGVSVNVLVTIPALNADPKAGTNQVNTTLFLLLETEDGYEKFPVDILKAHPESVGMERLVNPVNDKIVGKLLSLRRDADKNKDELVIGVSLTNRSNETIHGIMVGPEITAIDSANNMFAIEDSRNIKGITTCEYGKKLYNEMSWCENQLKKNAFSTTSFRPGVPVNVLVTIPALQADPSTETTKINSTLFLLLENEGSGSYEKFPVDIIGAKAS